MKILVFSDSHGDETKMINIIRDSKDIDKIIFLGDGVRDIDNIGGIYTNAEVIAVKGNNDFFSDLPDERCITLENTKLFLAHGHTYGVKYGFERIKARAESFEAKVVLYGHTHMASTEIIDNILFLNPGSIGYPPYMYAELVINEKGITSNIKHAE